MKNASFVARIAPLAAAALLVAAPASAQSLVGAGINAAGESGGTRAPIFVSSAAVAPKGHFGFGVQAMANRTSLDEAGFDYTENSSVALVSGHYGVTSRITLGGYLPYQHSSVESTFDGDSFDESDGGMGDAGVFTRVALMQSASGMTRFGMNGVVTLATGDEGFSDESSTYGVGATLSHNTGRMALHVGPELTFVKDQDAYIGLNAAGVFSATPKLGLTVEALSVFGGKFKDAADDEEGAKEIDLATGLRYRLAPHVALDGALRYNVASQLDPKPTAFGLQVGMHWGF